MGIMDGSYLPTIRNLLRRKITLRAIIQTETINGTPRTVTKEEYQKWVDKVDEDHTSFDWYKYIWVSAPQSYVNANVSGGTEKVRYYLSLGHIDQEGNIRGFNGFNRTNMQSNIDIDITNRFKVGVAINGRIETTDNPGLPGDDYNLPIYGAYNNLPTKKPYANNNLSIRQYRHLGHKTVSAG